MSRHIVTCLVQNGPLAVARIAMLCAQRRYAVESIIAIPGEDPAVIRVTVVMEADQPRIENAVKQLDKLVDVLRIDVLSPASPVACELLLTGVGAVLDQVAAGHITDIGAHVARGVVTAAEGLDKAAVGP
jgi:acetolactate synthase I/III small subunit